MMRIIMFILFVPVISILTAQEKYFVSTDSSVYHYGDSIHITVGVTNIGDAPDTLWLSDCDVEYSIDSFQLAGHRPCSLTMKPYVISPGDSLQWSYLPAYAVTKEDLSEGSHAVIGEVGVNGFSDTLWITISSLNAVRENPAVLQGYVLENNYPDPFNPSTIIGYRLPVKSYVILMIYNALGQEVATLVNKQQDAGTYSVTFNASTLPSGTYFYRLRAGIFTETKKLSVVK